MSIFIKISPFHASKSVWILKMTKWKILARTNKIEFGNFAKFFKNLKSVEIQWKTGFSLSKIFAIWQLLIILNPNCMLTIDFQILNVVNKSHKVWITWDSFFSELGLRKRPSYNSKRLNQSILLLMQNSIWLIIFIITSDLEALTSDSQFQNNCNLLSNRFSVSVGVICD